jgi:hypothetical protein
MDLSDIQYLIELLDSSIDSQDWDNVQEAVDFLREASDEGLMADDEERD